MRKAFKVDKRARRHVSEVREVSSDRKFQSDSLEFRLKTLGLGSLAFGLWSLGPMSNVQCPKPVVPSSTVHRPSSIAYRPSIVHGPSSIVHRPSSLCEGRRKDERPSFIPHPSSFILPTTGSRSLPVQPPDSNCSARYLPPRGSLSSRSM